MHIYRVNLRNISATNLNVCANKELKESKADMSNFTFYDLSSQMEKVTFV